MAFRKYKPSGTTSTGMAPLDFSRKPHERDCSEVVISGGSAQADGDIDIREVYFLIMHFLSSGPCKRTYGQIWNELLEHDLLPRRYHAWYSRSGSHSGNENDNGHSLPLSYLDLVGRYPHIQKDHLVKLLRQLILCSSPLDGMLGRDSTNGIDVSSLLGSGAFSLLESNRGRQPKKTNNLAPYLRWPHMHADQVRGLSLREIGGGFSKHRRPPSVRAACYAIAKPSTMVQKMQVIRKLRGHQNAVYCAIFDRSGRYVITGSDDRLVKIWSMETAFCLSSCRGHEGDITDLAVSSNNALVASASNDFIIRVWRLPDGLPISVLKGHTGAVTAIAFSPRPSSTYHLLSSSDDGTCRIWDARYSQSNPRVYIPKPPDAAAGRSSNPTSSTGQPAHQILCCAYNANGTVFVTGSSDTYARVWNACRPNSDDSDQPNHEMDLLSGHENDVNYVQFSGCAVPSKFSASDNSKEDNIPKFKNSWFTHDNIVTCSRDGSAIIWIPRSRRSHGKVGRWTRAYHLKVPPPPMPPQPPRGGPRQRFQPTPRGVNMIVWSLDNRFVLAAIMDCRICVWNASDGSLVHSLIGHSQYTFVLDVHPFNPRIAMSAGYDGKTIVWDIWEGTPVRIYETGRFELVDGKFSPDGTSIVLSDKVGQIFIIATGQGESQKDAKYDQFFLGDYRPLMQDVHRNTLDQETQLAPYQRNIQDLLCDSSMIPYPEPYQSMYQRRRLGALGIEWRPSSLKFAVGPSNNVNAGDYQIFPIVDLERWVESLEAVPEYVDPMDWELGYEVQSDDNDSEYNVTEEFSSERERGSLSVCSSGEGDCSAEDSQNEYSSVEGLRRSKRRKPKPEAEFTSSGRRVKRRNLDEHGETTRNKRKRRKKNGKLTSKKKSSKAKAHRPQRRAARNALSFLSQMGEGSTDGEEEVEEEVEEEEEEEDVDSDTYSTDDDSNDQIYESEESFLNSPEEFEQGKQVKEDESEDVENTSLLNDANHSNAGTRKRLILRLPVRDPKRVAFSEKTSQSRDFPPLNSSSAKKYSNCDGTNENDPRELEPGQSSGQKFDGPLSQSEVDAKLKEEEERNELFDNQPKCSSENKVGKVKWGEVKTRSSKRIRVCDIPGTSAWPASGASFDNPCSVTENDDHLESEKNCHQSRYLAVGLGDDGSVRNMYDNGKQLNSVAEDLDDPENLEDKLPLHEKFSSNLLQRDLNVVACNGDATETRKHGNHESVDLSETGKHMHTGEACGLDNKISTDSCQYIDNSRPRGNDINNLDNDKPMPNGIHGDGYNQSTEKAAQPIYRKLRITSKRSMYEHGSSSKIPPALDDSNADCGLRSSCHVQEELKVTPVDPEEDVRSSGSSYSENRSRRPARLNGKVHTHVYKRSKRHRRKKESGDDPHFMEESTSNREDLNESLGVDLLNGPNRPHHTRSSGVSSSGRERRSRDTSDASKSRYNCFLNGHDSVHIDDRRAATKMTVGLRSARNRRENYSLCDLNPLDKRKGQVMKKPTWLMLPEHEESYRYIPQLGDEVAYLRQGHSEYLDTTKSSDTRPLKTTKGLKAVEFCKVKSLEYCVFPGSGDSCCKLTLEFIDHSSIAFGKAFKLTLPELVEFPDFLVERTRYDASIERNWTHRDKCRVWWRNEDDDGGSWWEGRIIATKAKSAEFPDSPWERYVVQYKNDTSEQHLHSPWELHDTDTRWEHPHVDDERRKELLSSFDRIERTSLRNRDNCGIQKLNHVSQKSDFLNRFPVPLSLDLIKTRLENNYYRSLEAVKHDTTVMLSNAQLYFENSEFTAKMRRLSELISRVLPS